MDKNQFGKSNREQQLARVLNELGNKKLSKRITKLFTSLNTRLYGVKVSDTSTAQWLYGILRQEYFFTVANISLDYQLDKHLTNLLEYCVSRKLRLHFGIGKQNGWNPSLWKTAKNFKTELQKQSKYYLITVQCNKNNLSAAHATFYYKTDEFNKENFYSKAKETFLQFDEFALLMRIEVTKEEYDENTK